mmetsp:Transcript_45816/g.75801  ORF Transcript_45816/g.75801 Transcript_45816/m.75801 type:complete len:249 (+) Transcript_45816:121-867(+)
MVITRADIEKRKTRRTSAKISPAYASLKCGKMWTASIEPRKKPEILPMESHTPKRPLPSASCCGGATSTMSVRVAACCAFRNMSANQKAATEIHRAAVCDPLASPHSLPSSGLHPMTSIDNICPNTPIHIHNRRRPILESMRSLMSPTTGCTTMPATGPASHAMPRSESLMPRLCRIGVALAYCAPHDKPIPYIGHVTARRYARLAFGEGSLALVMVSTSTAFEYGFSGAPSFGARGGAIGCTKSVEL